MHKNLGGKDSTFFDFWQLSVRNFVKAADGSGILGIIFFIFLTGKFQLPFCTDQTNF